MSIIGKSALNSLNSSGMPKLDTPKSRWRMPLLFLLLGYGLLVAYWMLFGFGRSVVDTPQYNLVPFATIKLFLSMAAYHPWAAAANLLGNVLIFVPFGLLISPVLGGGFWRMLLIFSGCVIGLECSQMILHRGSLDVDDLMLNVVGAMIGYAMLIGFSAIFRSIRRHPVS